MTACLGHRTSLCTPEVSGHPAVFIRLTHPFSRALFPPPPSTFHTSSLGVPTCHFVHFHPIDPPCLYPCELEPSTKLSLTPHLTQTFQTFILYHRPPSCHLFDTYPHMTTITGTPVQPSSPSITHVNHIIQVLLFLALYPFPVHILQPIHHVFYVPHHRMSQPQQSGMHPIHTPHRL